MSSRTAQLQVIVNRGLWPFNRRYSTAEVFQISAIYDPEAGDFHDLTSSSLFKDTFPVNFS